MHLADHRPRLALRRRSFGITLLELLIVVTIIGILAAIAYPSYVNYVIRTNRSAAKSVLVQVADRQEQHFSDNKRYAADLTRLGYSANGFMIDDRGAVVGATDADRLYEITLTDTSATTFTINAAPQLRQASYDDQCATLTLTHAGQKDHTGTGDDCW